jgi:hypothetical protein
MVSERAGGALLDRPLTERILSHLPGNRRGWIAAWTLIPWVNLAVLLLVNGFAWDTTAAPPVELFNRAAVSAAVLLSLWGAARIGRDLARLESRWGAALEHAGPDVERTFRGMGSALVPLLLTAAVALLLPLDEVLHNEPVAAVLQAATWLIIGIPLSTAVWVYLALQSGLYRLEREGLTLRPYRGDRTLGLQPVGELAFTGLWMLFGTVAPLVLTSFSDLPTVVVGSLVLAAGLVMFFVSLGGLHRRMRTIKQLELNRAAALYQEAYRRLSDQPTLEVLEQQMGVLNAAENLEKRAERIQEWPFDEATFALVATIATSATASILTRMLLAPTGL